VASQPASAAPMDRRARRESRVGASLFGANNKCCLRQRAPQLACHRARTWRTSSRPLFAPPALPRVEAPGGEWAEVSVPQGPWRRAKRAGPTAPTPPAVRRLRAQLAPAMGLALMGAAHTGTGSICAPHSHSNSNSNSDSAASRQQPSGSSRKHWPSNPLALFPLTQLTVYSEMPPT